MERLLALIKKIIPSELISAVRPLYHFSLSLLAALYYRFPSRRLIVIGVTGTKGKTTVVEALARILEEAGEHVASSSSLRMRIGDHIIPHASGMTMPGRFFLSRFLKEAADAGCRYAIIEVTSQGILQYRHRFIRFSAAVMTNISREHIEAHGGFEPYVRAKLDLFWRLSPSAIAVINRDDPHANRFFAASNAPILYYGKSGIEYSDGVSMSGLPDDVSDKKWSVGAIATNENGISFTLNSNVIVSPLLGEFNFYNLLAASAASLHFGIPLARIASVLKSVSAVEGRMEFIQKKPFAVVVDYAHTPDSLEEVYKTLSGIRHPASGASRLICVLGAAGGGRDKWKRPEMGRIAAEYCDRIILTNEDPFDDDPDEIIDQIERGAARTSKLKTQSIRKILDRRKAIKDALGNARAGEIVIITGKGSEQWIRAKNGKKIPWDDRETVREELKHL